MCYFCANKEMEKIKESWINLYCLMFFKKINTKIKGELTEVKWNNIFSGWIIEELQRKHFCKRNREKIWLQKTETTNLAKSVWKMLENWRARTRGRNRWSGALQKGFILEHWNNKEIHNIINFHQLLILWGESFLVWGYKRSNNRKKWISFNIIRTNNRNQEIKCKVDSGQWISVSYITIFFYWWFKNYQIFIVVANYLDSGKLKFLIFTFLSCIIK